MARVTYARQAEQLAGEINKRLIQQGAKTFCLLRSDEQGPWIGRPAGSRSAWISSSVHAKRFWLSFTRQTDGTLEHTTSVFADNPKDAAKYLKGFLDATCLKGFLD
jgi:hypothetical protein